MSAQDAQDIAQMNNAKDEIPIASSSKKRSGLLWVVLGCVVVGVSLGIFVYRQSLKPAGGPSPSPKTAGSSPKTSPIASAVVPQVSEVNAEPKTITFPKAGKLRVYYFHGGWMPLGIILKDSAGNLEKIGVGAGTPSTPMKIVDTGLEITASEALTIDSYLGSNESQLSIGWATPVNNSCGFNGFGTLSIASYVTWATEQAKGEPLVSVQCWGDYSPNPGDTSAKDFNDYVLIWSYTPASASVAPSSSPSPSPSPTASSVASISPSPSPSPSPSVKASSSPTAGTLASVTPTPSARAAMPDTSEGVPVTGVFEVTVGTVSVGLLLLVLGLVGLLAL